ncbi:Gfo/Idh/MocA family oxidoreductase [Opitutales bacterium ASA1]|uniref:Gfo/Idh/MocA family protein n=1 Tax=Congregicoccus parvus TaxID=3081749 RepID=UPI002B285CB5|nr:Gfo/Idh/MocA family oxidoreductase [Opitutales bacterium ASA1]
MKTWTRKEFLKTSALAAGAAWLSGCSTTPAAAPAVRTARRASPNDDVRVAIVGIRGKGAQHIGLFRGLPGVKVAALCEVDSEIMAKHVRAFDDRGEKVAAYRDYRDLLDDPTIDAVVVATPNHWHSLMSVWACQAGKDVYLEKPISHNVWEGRKTVEAAARYGRIVQAGIQSRSDDALREVFALVQAGELGRVQWVRGLCYKLRPSIGKTSGPQRIPASIDYDLWTGPAALVPPHRNSENGTVHYDWHWLWNYGGGDIANQGIHEVDMCRRALGQAGLPPRVTSIGGRFGYDDDAETPNTQIAIFDYEPAPLIFEVRGLPRKAAERAMDAYRGTRVGLSIQCEHGYFAGGGGGGAFYDNSGKQMRRFSSAGGGGHAANFIAAVRSRRSEDLAGRILDGHVSSALCHLANISYRLGTETDNARIREMIAAHAPTADSFGRMLEHLRANEVDVDASRTVLGPSLDFDPNSERFIVRESFDFGHFANTMLRRDYRAPFVVPENV